MSRIVTYECVQCGTEVIVNENLETKLRPIYCCGIRVEEVSSVPKPELKKKAVAKVTKAAAGKLNAAGKSTTKTKKPAKASPVKAKKPSAKKTASRARK
ncbi:MAG: hypothetical protein M0024_00370 [Nitrospiraceae bacterium]|nr:hypothetical protein [Nitrospiraceae bacterium]